MPDGTEITAWMKGFSEPLAPSAIGSNAFTILAPQYGSESMDGHQIEFQLNGLLAEPAAIWIPGGADMVELTASTDGNS